MITGFCLYVVKQDAFSNELYDATSIATKVITMEEYFESQKQSVTSVNIGDIAAPHWI